MSILQWVTSTIAVLALILLLGRALRFLMARGAFESGPCSQVGQWRVAPDAAVRAVKVMDRVYLTLETRRQTVALDTLSVRDFEDLLPHPADTSGSFLLRILPQLRPAVPHASAESGLGD